MWLSTSYRSIVQSKQAQRKESLSIALTAVTDSDLQHDYLHATGKRNEQSVKASNLRSPKHQKSWGTLRKTNGLRQKFWRLISRALY